MGARNYLQWELVGEGSDPVVASEHDVEQSAKIFSDQGTQMDDAAALLKQIADLSGWTGEAAKELADKADDAYSDLDKAAQKYIDAGKALDTFATAVGTARTETAAAVADAVEAEAQRKANATSDLEGVSDPTDAQKDADEKRGERLDSANAALSAARTRLVNALEDLDGAASTCAGAIKAASENFSDSRWDDIKGAVSSALAVIVDALQVLAVILAIVIIVLLIIGTGGAILAVLVPLAFYLGATILALTLVQFAMGDADWKDVAWAALGVVGGGSVLKGAAGAAKALTAVKIAQEGRLTAQAIKNLSPLVKLGKRIPINLIRNWAMGKQAAAVTDALSAFRGQMSTIPALSNTALLRVAGLDGILSNVRQINALRAMSPTMEMTQSLNLAMRNVKIEGFGAIISPIAQGHDFLTIDGPLNNTINNLQDLGSHLSGAGR